MSLIKRLLRVCFGKYEIYRIYQSPAPEGVAAPPHGGLEFGVLGDPQKCEESQFKEIRELASYFGKDSIGFGIWRDGVLSCASVYWYGYVMLANEDFGR